LPISTILVPYSFVFYCRPIKPCFTKKAAVSGDGSRVCSSGSGGGGDSPEDSGNFTDIRGCSTVHRGGKIFPRGGSSVSRRNSVSGSTVNRGGTIRGGNTLRRDGGSVSDKGRGVRGLGSKDGRGSKGGKKGQPRKVSTPGSYSFLVGNICCIQLIIYILVVDFVYCVNNQSY
jgi:hypothetical protein